MKKNASLSGVQKVEELRKMGVSIDEKIKPLLNAEQQPKFEALREQARRRIVEEMGSEVLQKLEKDFHWNG